MAWYADGTVRPHTKITRAEVTTMFYRLLTAQRRDDIFTSRNSFRDVPTDMWCNKAVSSMAAGGYITGYSDGTFGGSKTITRAEFVAIASRFMDAQAGDVSFSDVPINYWVRQYIATAVSYGWINGYSDGTFKPDRPITRGEAITIINRMLNRGVEAKSVVKGVKNWADCTSAMWCYYDVMEATNDHTYTGSRPTEKWRGLKVQYFYDIAKYEHP